MPALTSTQTAPLQQWTFKPIIELGAGVIIPHEVVATADKAFFRLKYTDQVPGEGKTLDTADYDSDEINLHLTNPLEVDTDGDWMWDDYEVANSVDPTDEADGLDDFDGDLLRNQLEFVFMDMGYEPFLSLVFINLKPGNAKIIAEALAKYSKDAEHATELKKLIDTMAAEKKSQPSQWPTSSGEAPAPTSNDTAKPQP